MHFFVIIILFFFPICSIFADQNLEMQTQLNLRSALYEKAAVGFQNLLRQSAEAEKKREWSSNLAFCFFRTENYAALPPLLEPLSPLNDQERLFLGAAYTHLGRFDDAIHVLTPSEDPQLDSEISIEKGIAYFRWNKFYEAMSVFEAISQDANGFSVALIYRAKIAIALEEFAKAQQIIDAHMHHIQPPLVYELYYLQGIAAARTHNYALAIDSFKRAVPSPKAPWARDAYIQLGAAYLASAQDLSGSKEHREDLFNKAIETMLQADALYKTDDLTLALGHAYLTKGRNLEDDRSIMHARSLLTDSSLFSNRNTQNQALFLAIQATPGFEERDALYRRLTQEKNSGFPQYGFWWLSRGIHDLSQSQLAEGEMRDMLVKKALSAFEKAELHLADCEKPQARVWSGRAHLLENTPVGFEKAKQIFAQLLASSEAFSDTADLYYLYAQALNQGAEVQSKDIEWLAKGVSTHQTDRGLFQLAILHYNKEDWFEAEKLFSQLTKSSDFHIRTEALFWAGKSAVANGVHASHYFQTLYKEYPHHPLAAEAYFSLYSYKEYLQGDRDAMKHLQQLPDLFPESVFTLNAYYLTGLDYKRDRKSNAGKKIRQRDLNGAIDAFTKLEEKFEELSSKNLVPASQLEYSVRLYYYALLERALANLTIAEQSEGAKQEIFLEYAQGQFAKIVADFTNKTHPFAQMLLNKESFPAIEEEATYWLAVAHHKGKDIQQAVDTLENILEKFASVRVSRGYFLSRTWSELGSIYIEERDYKKALASLEKAEETGKGGILTAEDMLQLWIQKSECYRGQQDYDNAIRILTQVTHEKVISGLRLKAMFLRSELYALQNRPELERNQLIALSKKGGEWALKARQTLEQKYGY